jgi:chromate reductase
MRILGISGSLRRDSHNTALLRAAAELLPPGVELELFDGLREIPPYDADVDTPELQGPAVEALKDAIERADAVLISTPEYNHSIPGVLKNALDWASRPVAETVLRGKPAAVVGASTGLFGAVWAQAEVRKVLGATGAEVVDRELPVMQAHAQFDEYGNLREEDLRGQLAEHLAALVAAASQEGRSLGVPKAASPSGDVAKE